MWVDVDVFSNSGLNPDASSREFPVCRTGFHLEVTELFASGVIWE